MTSIPATDWPEPPTSAPSAPAARPGRPHQPAAPARTKTAPADGWRGMWARVRAYWGGDIESPWSEAPASMAELVRYARAGAWCADGALLTRWAGMAYCYLIAIPMSFQLYIRAWIYQRPGRFLAFAALTTVLRLSVGLSVWLVAKYLIF